MAVLKIKGIIGKSREIQKCLLELEKASKATAPVLIIGEIGTGKRLFAQKIHENSPLRDKPFRIFEVPNFLKNPFILSKGGAFKENIVKVGAGTLVFPDIDTLNLDLQRDLASFLSEQSLRLNVENIEAPFRLIATTTKSSNDLLSRDDCMPRIYRAISKFEIQLPALRERKEDIKDIATYHLRKICADKHVNEKEISKKFFKALEKYNWPNNIKELIEVLEISFRNSGNSRKLEVDYLPINIYFPEITSTEIGPISIPDNLVKELEDINEKMVEKRYTRPVGSNTEGSTTAGIPNSTQKKDNVVIPEAPKDSDKLILCFYEDEDDDCWRVGHIGKEKRIKQLIGVKIIHFLLSRPNRYIGCAQLYTSARGVAVNIEDATNAFTTNKAAADNTQDYFGLEIRKYIDKGNNYDILDNKYKRDIKNMCKVLKDEIKEMEDCGSNYEELLEKKDQLKLLEEYIKKRKQPDHTSQDEKARSNIQKNIKRARDIIIDKVPYMKGHLKNITTATSCVYEPDFEEKEPEWILSKQERDRRI